MKRTIWKYKIGLVVLLLAVIGLVVLVLVQASATKADAKTKDAANSIADKLNNYIFTNEVVPSSLAQAGVQNVPAAISYQKLSATSYKFCATYKTTSSGFDATGAVTDVISSGAVDANSSFTDTSTLVIPDTHHKGANCQTIKPNIIQHPVSPIQLLPCQTMAGKTGCQPDVPPSGNCNASTHGEKPTMSGTITSVATLNDTTDRLGVRSSTGVAYTVTVSANRVFDSHCLTLYSPGIRKGDSVDVFLEPQTSASHTVVAKEVDDNSQPAVQY